MEPDADATAPAAALVTPAAKPLLGPHMQLLVWCSVCPPANSTAARTAALSCQKGQTAELPDLDSPLGRDRRVVPVLGRIHLPEPTMEITMPRSHAAETQTQPTDRCRHPQDRLAPYLPTLRQMLLEQRAFRLEQLVELRAAEGRTMDTDAADTDADRARREVAALMADGARRAMADIGLALASMVAGRYGCCHACHADIPLAVLEVIPQARLCLSCQRSESDLR
jgi:DnaK suppressor protein